MESIRGLAKRGSPKKGVCIIAFYSGRGTYRSNGKMVCVDGDESRIIAQREGLN